MKIIINTVMMGYQYAYYQMIKWDKKMLNVKSTEWLTRGKAIITFGIVETWAILAVYILLVNVLFEQPIHKNSPTSIVMVILYAFFICYINQLMLGSKKQTEHYHHIFNTWSQQKQTRWSFYLISIAVSIFVIFLFVVKLSRPMLKP